MLSLLVGAIKIAARVGSQDFLEGVAFAMRRNLTTELKKIVKKATTLPKTIKNMTIGVTGTKVRWRPK